MRSGSFSTLRTAFPRVPLQNDPDPSLSLWGPRQTPCGVKVPVWNPCTRARSNLATPLWVTTLKSGEKIPTSRRNCRQNFDQMLVIINTNSACCEVSATDWSQLKIFWHQICQKIPPNTTT